MKNTFTIIFLFISLFAFNRDLGLHQASPVAYSELKAGEERNINIILKAHTAFEPGETLSIKYIIDGGTTQVSIPSMSLVMLSKGQLSPLFACPIQVPNLDNDTISLTIFFELEGDTNQTNDSLTLEYIVRERISNDLAITIVKPVQNQKLRAHEPSEFWVNYKNVGSNTLETGTSLLSFITLNGVFHTNPSQISYSGQNLMPRDSTIHEFHIDFDAADVGKSFEVCFHSFWSELTDTAINTIEGNYNDNTGCVNIEVTWPSSVKELKDPISQLAVFQNELRLTFSKPTRTMGIEVWNLNGQRVSTFNKTGEISTAAMDIGEISNGVYLLKVATESGAIYTRKFLKE